MQTTIDNINYKFIPYKVVSFDNIIKNKKIMENDIYEKYEATAIISGELIICNDVIKMPQSTNKIKRESFETYVKTLDNRDPAKDKWVYNILDGITEQEMILYRDEKCVVIPSFRWDSKNVDKLHILCFPIDVSLRTIRSLTSEHISLLEHMKNIVVQIIKKKYHLEEDCLKMFFHYEPSTYHLHIHFANISNFELGSSVEYSHDLYNVMFILSICSNYYKDVILNCRS